MKPLTIALAKGRLFEPAVALFDALGYDLREARDSRKLVIEDPRARFLIAKAADVPVYVEHGAADVGVVGQDVVRETSADVYEPLALDFGHCRLMVAGKPERAAADWRFVAGLRVATKYARCAQRY